MILSVALLIGVPPMNHVEASSLSFAGKVYKADKQEEPHMPASVPRAADCDRYDCPDDGFEAAD